MNSGSIGIIGGADGPTAIFLSSRFPWGACALVLLVLGGAAAVAFFLHKR